MRGIPAKARLLTLVVIFSNVSGNLALSAGMRGASNSVRAFFSPLVLFGVSLLILWLVSRMTLMSWADLSYILPITSIGYVLSAIAGKVILGEQISAPRWTGILLITAGMALVSTTAHKT
jgi:uncharacterized membrane protein